MATKRDARLEAAIGKFVAAVRESNRPGSFAAGVIGTVTGHRDHPLKDRLEAAGITQQTIVTFLERFKIRLSQPTLSNYLRGVRDMPEDVENVLEALLDVDEGGRKR